MAKGGHDARCRCTGVGRLWMTFWMSCCYVWADELEKGKESIKKTVHEIL